MMGGKGSTNESVERRRKARLTEVREDCPQCGGPLGPNGRCRRHECERELKLEVDYLIAMFERSQGD